MKPTYLVFDIAHQIDPFQTTVRGTAQEYFSEYKQEDKDVRMVAYYGDERPEDLTPDAVELAARDWLDRVGDFDLPGWVYRSDSYDDWQKETTSARREFEDMREQGVA